MSVLVDAIPNPRPEAHVSSDRCWCRPWRDRVNARVRVHRKVALA